MKVRCVASICVVVVWLFGQGVLHPFAVSPAVKPGAVGTKITAHDTERDDHFGEAVSISGDTLVVGAHWKTIGTNDMQGAVYVFERTESGPQLWEERVKVVAADGDALDYLGTAVSVDGDTLVVGAPLAKTNDGIKCGAAYVFYRNRGGPDQWGQVAKLMVDDGEQFDDFGRSVSVSGDTVLIGAPGVSHAEGEGWGAAYVFARNQGGDDQWGQVTKLLDMESNVTAFGWSVTVQGNLALIGAYGGVSGPGAAYLYHRNEGGVDAWGRVAKLTADTGEMDDWFGNSVSLSPDQNTALVGAPHADVEGQVDQGAAYVFARNQENWAQWEQVARLTAAGGVAGDWAGSAVALSEDRATLGAPHATVDGRWRVGAAFLFSREHGGPGAWGELRRLTAVDRPVGGSFGWSVAANGDIGVIGAPIAGYAGAAYVYVLPRVSVYVPLVWK